MIQSLLLGLLGAASALAGTLISDNVDLLSKKPAETTTKTAYQVKKAGTLNVPILRQGVLRGYIVIRVAFATEGSITDMDSHTLEALVQDEVFRTLYSDTSINPLKLDQFDLTDLTKQLSERIRARVSSDAFRDILISEFTFVPTAASK